MKKKLVIVAVLTVLVALPLVAYRTPTYPMTDKELDSYKEGYGDHPTVLIYGLIKGAPSYINFYQTDSRLPPSVIGKLNIKKNVYYGEALCGASYKLFRYGYNSFRTLNYYIATLGDGSSTFDFNAPKETGIYYLGLKDEKGNIILDNENELKFRLDGLKVLAKEYKKTDWINLIDEEIEKVQAMIDEQDSK